MDKQETANAAEQSWTVDMFRPEDAPGVVGLYRAIYGESFPLPEVYCADWHVEQTRTHDTYRAVARTAGGTVIGTGAVFRSSPTNPELYEIGGFMTLPECSKQNMVLELFKFTLKIPLLFNISQTWAECVCNHLFAQMHFIKSGNVACALEVDLLPDDSFESQAERGLDTAGRVAALVIAGINQPTAHPLYLPPIYEPALKKIYEPLQIEHTFLEAREMMFDNQGTGALIDIKGTAGFSRMTVHHLGADFPGWLRQAEQEAKQAGAVVFQIIVPLSTPNVGWAADCLKNEGYWLGGLMPGWFGADGFLMQKTLHEPDFSKIKVYSKPGKEILQMVQADYEKQQLA